MPEYIRMIAEQKDTVRDSRPSSRAYAEAFRVAQEGGVSEVIALLDSPDHFVRGDAIKQIGRRRLSDAAPRLEQLVVEDDELKLAALLALERLALPESRPVFSQRFDDEAMSRVALRGLLSIGAPEAVSAAEEAYRTGDRVTREVALYVLSRAGTERSRETFEALLEVEPSWRWRRKIRKSIYKARWGEMDGGPST